MSYNKGLKAPKESSVPSSPSRSSFATEIAGVRLRNRRSSTRVSIHAARGRRRGEVGDLGGGILSRRRIRATGRIAAAISRRRYLSARKQMAYVEESKRPAVSRVVMNYLRVNPGPVDDLFLVKNLSSTTKEGIFAIIHVLKKLVRSEFTYSVNYTREAQLLIRCTVPGDAEKLDATNGMFKFDNQRIKLYKLESISLLPQEEDTVFHAAVKAFPAHTEGMAVLGYPGGYSDVLEDMEKHKHPRLSVSSMRTLNLEEGPVERVFQASIKYSFSPEEFVYAIRLVPFVGLYTYTVDQDGEFYLKLDREEDVELLSCAQFYVSGMMLKFRKVLTVKNRRIMEEKAIICPVYSRVCSEDHWERVVV